MIFSSRLFTLLKVYSIYFYKYLASIANRTLKYIDSLAAKHQLAEQGLGYVKKAGATVPTFFKRNYLHYTPNSTMDKFMLLAIVVSASIHVIIILMFVPGAQSWIPTKSISPPPPTSITVDLLAVKDRTNVKSEQPKEAKPAKPKPAPKRPKIKQRPNLPSPEKRTKTIPGAEAKPMAKKNDTPNHPIPRLKPRPEAEIEQLLKDLSKEEEEETVVAQQSTLFDPTKQLSRSVQDSIRSQIEANWNVNPGIRGIRDMQVLLEIKLAQDGTVIDVKIVDQARAKKNQFFKVLAESAERAVWKTKQVKYLPEESYPLWRHFEMNFIPPV